MSIPRRTVRGAKKEVEVVGDKERADRTEQEGLVILVERTHLPEQLLCGHDSSWCTEESL